MQSMNTIIDEGILESVLHCFYNLTNPISCKFIRRSFNDHYVV